MTRRDACGPRRVRPGLTKVGTCLLATTLAFLGTACAAGGAKSSSGAPEGEISLAADRSELDELRKDIPEEVRRQNDELALILTDMASSNQEPGRVRERFNTSVRKKREAMDRQLRGERESFGKSERDSREAFLKKATEERASFAGRKRDRDERRRFFERQDAERREFFAELSDKRRAFESTVTQRRRDFEDHNREQTNEFNQAHREYSKTYYDRQKAEALKKRMQEKEKRLAPAAVPAGSAGGSRAAPADDDRALLEEMRSQPKGKVTPLKAEDK